MAEGHNQELNQTRTPFVRPKVENDGDSTAGHSHKINVIFDPKENKNYNIYCNQPRTVLEALKSSKKYSELEYPDENIVIQVGKADMECIVATHFPCSCISKGKTLIISSESEKVEKAQGQHYKPIYTRDRYSVFYIDTVGGINTKTKKLFRNNAVKQFKYLCVYGEKGMTVEEALKTDGRFIDDLGDFTLSDNENPKSITESTEKVDILDGKHFKLCLPKKKKENYKKQQKTPGASNNSQQKCGPTQVLRVVHQRRISLRTAVKKRGSSDNTEEIQEILRQQFSHLKELMENRFPGDSYQTALNLRKEDFGKIQQSFSEVHRVRKLLKLGESVCKVVVKNICGGTGFVLFDNFVLTNAHLFKDCVEGENLKEGVDVSVCFNYEDPDENTHYNNFPVKTTLIDYSEGELDYAILELNPEGQKPSQTPETKTVKVPPGLLKEFCPLPPKGEACIIGHPAGGVKKMDPTCIIEIEKREQAVNDQLQTYKDSVFIVQSIRDIIKDQGIESKMMGGNRAESVVTYNTFMYHGSSGSPVFDAGGRVFGLHTAGYVYGFPEKESVIEFAQPLLTIFKNFVTKLKRNADQELLKRVEKQAKGNQYLQKELSSMTTDTEESMEM